MKDLIIRLLEEYPDRTDSKEIEAKDITGILGAKEAHRLAEELTEPAKLEDE
jgi:hypothetical protein